MFTRYIQNLNSGMVYPGSNYYDFVSLGAHTSDPYPFFRLTLANISEAMTYDFITEEMSGIGVIKYKLRDGVVRKDEITERVTTSPLLIMQDLTAPVAYLYPDITNVVYPDEYHHTKSGMQEVNYDPGIGLPVIRKPHFDFATDISDISSLPRYAIKGNWHYFANSILCDTVDILIRPRIESGLLMEVFNFI